MCPFIASRSFLITLSLSNNIDITYVDRTTTNSINIVYNSDLNKYNSLYKNNLTDYSSCQNLNNNIRMHSAESYSWLDFSESLEARCSMKTVEHTDAQGKKQMSECHFQIRANHGVNQGLRHLAEELKWTCPSQSKP
jgi:hypothetical protein